MHKVAALTLALILTIALAFVFSHSSESRQNITLARVIDGDTLESVDGRTIRLANINTPEKGTPQAEHAAKYLSLFEGKEVEIEALGTDKYGRTLARLYAPEYINKEIVASGFAVKFLVEDGEARTFAAAESRAIAEQRGIWSHAPEFGCISATVEEQAEYVVLQSLCGPLNIAGWTVRDESRKHYVFNEQMLTRLALYTGRGSDNATAVFWNSASPIWNNDRDTLYLLDSEGRIVHHAAYGYSE